MRTVAVYTANDRLFRKIELLAAGHFNVVRAEEDETEGGFDAVIVDREYTERRHTSAYVLPHFRDENGAAVTLPVSLSEIWDYIIGSETRRTDERPTLVLKDKRREVIFGGQTVRLTEVEFKLLSALASRAGYTPREELLQEVWGEGVDPGVLNVYVHYLREKLEGGGERIILSSRKLGYAIDERYKKEEEK